MYAVDNDTLPLFLSHELPPPPPANDSQMERVNCEAAYGWSYDRRYVGAYVYRDDGIYRMVRFFYAARCTTLL